MRPHRRVISLGPNLRSFVVFCCLAIALPTTVRAAGLVQLRFPASVCADSVGGGGFGFCTPDQTYDDYYQFYDNFDTRSDALSETTFIFHPRLGTSSLSGDIGLALGWFNPSLVPLEGTATSELAWLPADDSSFLRLRWRPHGWRTGEGISLALYPYSSDRLRLGYRWGVSWGGSAIFLHATNPDLADFALTSGAVPGARLALRKGRVQAFVGAKATSLLDVVDNKTHYVGAVLGGAGVDLPASLRLEANGGWFDRGVNPKEGVLGQPVRSYGASVQLSYAHGAGVPREIDYSLATRDPTSPDHAFRKRTDRAGLSYVVSGEATWVATTLQDPDHPTKSTAQNAWASDLELRMQDGAWRFEATAMMRSLAFILLNVPGFDPFQAISPADDTTPETFFTVRSDFHLPRLRLTPGIAAGLEAPSTFTGSFPKALAGNIPQEALPQAPTVVIDNPGEYEILPPCATGPCTAAPLLGAKAFVRVDIVGGHLAGYVEVHFQRDANITALERRSPQDPYVRVLADANEWGGRATLVGRY